MLLTGIVVSGLGLLSRSKEGVASATWFREGVDDVLCYKLVEE